MDESEANRSELDSFRQEWQKEIKSRQEPGIQKKRKNSKNHDEPTKSSSEQGGKAHENISLSIAEQEKEEKARKLFLKGVEKERQKQMYEAIYFYKQAVHLVPDIESKIADYPTKFYHDASDSSDDDDGNDDGDDDGLNDKEEDLMSCNLEELTKQFKVLGVGGLCSHAFPSKETHISILPSELLIYIFRWVVSDELDLRSLEQASLVCKWFFACARDAYLWRTVCLRVWGVNCGSPCHYDGCWRRMLIERPHLSFHGVYINKNSYVRAGEQSLDAYYRPFHIVEYYRYIRFYADGQALICTSTDEPSVIVPLLKKKDGTASIMKGHYRLAGDIVNIVATRIQKNPCEPRSRRTNKQSSIKEHVFHLELKLKDGGKHRHDKLQWIHYSYMINNKSTGRSVSNQIDVQSFKPFHFSRVKSFHSTSSRPL